MRAQEFVVERKKRRKKGRGAYSGSGGWYGYYYGGGGESNSGGDGGGGESVSENSSSESNVIFLNDNAVIVGQEHGKKLKLSADNIEKIKLIADQHGAWYEGNGMDQALTKGIIDDYQGSWDDDLLSPKITGYPAAFLYVLFSNIKENDTVKGKIGSDPDSSIFDRILNTQPSTNYFPDRQFDAATLEKFLQSVSEGPYDFVQMSQAPATEQNVAKFFKLGEQLMWPNNWEEYPNRAGQVAKSVNDLRDKFLATRKRGVYVAGSDHLTAVRNFLNQGKDES
jgi:phage gp37-like protein